VIQIEQAYTIVRLNEHTTAGKAKFEDVKAQLEKELPQSKKEPASFRAGQEAASRTQRSKKCKRAAEGAWIRRPDVPKGNLVSKDRQYGEAKPETCNEILAACF
jgi:hypothetical protein